ncbi:hypothetical protein [Azotobacter vinelandii]|uniref:hypothetical protein n=1 Tax=Azotobacter vinelandii TaxID=354 RepID=UPI0007745E27|nr:hypothetical protein [Azotobacter vinelandii]
MPNHGDDRFVAHFDMLGMSTLTKRDPESAWQKLCDLSRARNERLHLEIERSDTNEILTDQVHSFIFSDTMIAFSKGNTQNDALALILLTTEVFTQALHYCIPLRGGISQGRFSFNFAANLFSGPALADAYELGETAQWLGIVVDERTAEIAKSIPLRSAQNEDVIVKWDVPLKNGVSISRNVVNWAVTHRNSYCGPVPLTVEAFYEPMANVFGSWQALPTAIQFKYENTVQFFNAQYGV